MNAHEVYLLSHLIDDGEVFSIERPKATRLMHERSIELLVAKGILADAKSFTEAGARLTRQIMDYKRAKKYVKVGSLTIGLAGTGEGVLLSRMQPGEFAFSRINMANSADEILGHYGFWSTCTRTSESPMEALEDGLGDIQVHERYGLTRRNCLYLSIADPQGVTNELIFAAGDSIILYDRDARSLTQMDAEDVKKHVLERLAL